MVKNFEIPKRNRKIFNSINDFHVGPKIGKGAFSKVYVGVHKNSNRKVAIKKILLDNLSSKDLPNLTREILIQRRLNHPNITKLYDFFLEENILYLILEFLPKSNLFRYLHKKKKLDFTKIQSFFKQCIHSLQYLHNLGFIHRDIKPENILLDEKEKNIKLCDFGWASHIQDFEWLELNGGTYAYMAPESLKREVQGIKTDIWALGILLYEMFFVDEPYKGKSGEEQLRLINTITLDFSKRKIPKSAEKLISKILKINKNERPTLEEILDDDFFKENFDRKNLLLNLRSNSIKTKIKKSALDESFDNKLFISNTSTSKVGKIERVFREGSQNKLYPSKKNFSLYKKSKNPIVNSTFITLPIKEQSHEYLNSEKNSFISKNVISERYLDNLEKKEISNKYNNSEINIRIPKNSFQIPEAIIIKNSSPILIKDKELFEDEKKIERTQTLILTEQKNFKKSPEKIKSFCYDIGKKNIKISKETKKIFKKLKKKKKNTSRKTLVEKIDRMYKDLKYKRDNYHKKLDLRNIIEHVDSKNSLKKKKKTKFNKLDTSIELKKNKKIKYKKSNDKKKKLKYSKHAKPKDQFVSFQKYLESKKIKLEESILKEKNNKKEKPKEVTSKKIHIYDRVSFSKKNLVQLKKNPNKSAVNLNPMKNSKLYKQSFQIENNKHKDKMNINKNYHKSSNTNKILNFDKNPNKEKTINFEKVEKTSKNINSNRDILYRNLEKVVKKDIYVNNKEKYKIKRDLSVNNNKYKKVYREVSLKRESTRKIYVDNNKNKKIILKSNPKIIKNQVIRSRSTSQSDKMLYKSKKNFVPLIAKKKLNRTYIYKLDGKINNKKQLLSFHQNDYLNNSINSQNIQNKSKIENSFVEKNSYVPSRESYIPLRESYLGKESDNGNQWVNYYKKEGEKKQNFNFIYGKNKIDSPVTKQPVIYKNNYNQRYSYINIQK